MRRIFAALLLLAALLGLAMAGGLVALLQDRPLVARSEVISPRVVARGRWLLRFHDPRRLARDQLRTVSLPGSDLDELLNYAAGRIAPLQARLKLGQDRAQVAATLALPDGSVARHLGRFLNLQFDLLAPGGKLQPGPARLGALPLPEWLVRDGGTTLVRLAGFGPELDLLLRAVRTVHINPQRAALTYAWQPELLDRAQARAASPETRAALGEAQRQLASALAPYAPGAEFPLVRILVPLLKVDASREAVRAQLLVSAAWLAGKKLTALMPEAADWPALPRVRPTLHGRHDWAQHFMVSAALAAWAGEPLADAIGLYKELADARGGSGFSFGDLTADRAGTRLGEMAAVDPERLAGLLARNPTDADLMPAAADLPENLSQGEFRRRFGGMDAPPYRAMVERIEARIEALPAYR
jgi:hypothetical protein